jgi:hypothetical protein
MADELTSNQAPAAPLPTTGGQAQADAAAPQSPAQPGPAAPTADAGTTPATEPKQQRKNLYEDPDVKRLVAAQERAYQQKMAALQAQLRDAQTRGLDDFQKVEYERNELRTALQQMQAQTEEREALAYRDGKLREISQEYGVPLEALQNAESPTDAYKLAADHLRTNRQREAAQAAQSREANRPYLGGGGAQTSSDRMTDAFTAARKARNPANWVRAVRESQQR